jgi:targeting protein for Xklp2
VKEASVLLTEPSPFQLEVDKRGIIKQQQLKQKMEEEARKLQQAAQFKAQSPVVIHKKPFQPKKSSRPVTDITAIEINTERRAKEREEFDTKVNLKQAILEESKRLKDEAQKREEMEEIARFRKEAVHKGNPIQRHKPLKVLSSDKPLTDPHSPAFLSRSKTNLKS